MACASPRLRTTSYPSRFSTTSSTSKISCPRTTANRAGSECSSSYAACVVSILSMQSSWPHSQTTSRFCGGVAADSDVSYFVGFAESGLVQAYPLRAYPSRGLSLPCVGLMRRSTLVCSQFAHTSIPLTTHCAEACADCAHDSVRVTRRRAGAEADGAHVRRLEGSVARDPRRSPSTTSIPGLDRPSGGIDGRRRVARRPSRSCS